MDYKLANHEAVIQKLNQIMEHELSGCVRYTHYSFMVFGYSRIPVVAWFRNAANENLMHANEAGEMITFFGEHPSLGIGELLESQRHDIGDILMEAMEFEIQGIAMYKQLLELVEEEDAIFLVEYARQKIAEESHHVGEIDKMLRQPGDISRAIQT